MVNYKIDIPQGMMEEEAGKNIKDYFYILWNRRQIILTIFLCTLVLSSIACFKLSDKYKSSAKMMLETTQKGNPVGMREIEYTMPELLRSRIYEFFRTQEYIITSFDFLKKMLEGHENIRNSFESTDINDMIAELRKKIEININHMRHTNLLEIEIIGKDPILVTKIANAITETYIKEDIANKFFVSKQIMEWFPEESKVLKKHTLMGQLEELSKRDVIQFLPSIADNSIINQLKEEKVKKENELRELSRFYKDKYPQIVELKQDISSLDSRINLETEKVLRTLKASIAGQLQLNTVRIIESARMPKAPFWPKRPRLILLSTFLSIILGSSLAFFLETLDQRIRDEEEFKKLNIPFLGYIPFIKKGINFDNWDKIVKENLSYVRTSILFSIPKDSSKMILVTSASPSEGKSTIAYLLAKIFSENAENVLLIESDIRKKSFFVNKKSTSNPKGLSDFLIGKEEFVSIIHKIGNMSIIYNGATSPNPSGLLGSYRMKEFLKIAEDRFDRVIIDSPPILGISDALILAKRDTNILLITNALKTDKKMVNLVKDRLESFNLKVMGAILNCMDTAKGTPYGYYFNRYYSKYYRTTDKDKKKNNKKERGADVISKQYIGKA